MTSPLSADRINTLCASVLDQIDIQVVAETGSTNADLLARIQNNAALEAEPNSPMLLIAEQQSAGRGRAGRQWVSAPSAALMFSLAWRFDLPLHQLVGLPLAVGVAIVEGINRTLCQLSGTSGEQCNPASDFGIRLKWPNDLLYGDGKLGGILIETAQRPPSDFRHNSASASAWAVIGVGINLTMPAYLQLQLDRKVANLPVPGPAAPERNLLMANLLMSLTLVLKQFQQSGLSTFVAPWNRLHAYAGQQVAILDQGKILHEGTALGIDMVGRFLLKTAQDEVPVAIMAGDVSLRVRQA